MVRITTYADGGWRSIPFEDFEAGFLEICEAHRAQGRALAFAFILFDRSHPYVREVLAQQNYWDALDDMSGRRLTVFSLGVPSSSGQGPVERRWMKAVEAPSYDAVAAELSRHFRDIDRLSLPCVLFFQVSGGQVIDHVIVTLTGAGLEETYDELSAVVGTAANAVSTVLDENASNAQEIFDLITASLADRAERREILRAIRVTKVVAEVVTVLQFLHWLASMAGR